MENTLMASKSTWWCLMLVMTALAGGAVLAAGAENDPPRDEEGRVLVQVERAHRPVEVDGRLDDPVWERAPRYSLTRSVADGRRDRPGTVIEGGYVQFAWDDDFLYVACNFECSDVIAIGEADQLLHHTLGDLMEVFLRPADFSWYWELYITPRAHRTLYFYPGPGHLPMNTTKEHDPSPLVAGAQVQGRLNNRTQRDQGWTGELAIPLDMLTSRGESFAPGADWLVLIGRYNYSRYLEADKQLTMFPQLPRTNFHDHPNWGRLVIRPASDPAFAEGSE